MFESLLEIKEHHFIVALSEIEHLDLTLGLSLEWNQNKAFLSDGYCCVAVLCRAETKDRNMLIKQLENDYGLRITGFNGQPAFKTSNQGLVSGTYFVEHLICVSERIEKYIKNMSLHETGKNWSDEITYSKVLALADSVRDGRIDYTEFRNHLKTLENAFGKQCNYAFFCTNFVMLVEHLRSNLVRAFEHYTTLNTLISNLLAQEVDGLEPLNTNQEITNSSVQASKIHGAFTDTVLTICSVLDLLYRIFVFSIREPFGNPELPSWLNFPFREHDKIFNPFQKNGCVQDINDQDASIWPHALPNLNLSSFRGLRLIRNDLTHNLTSGFLQANIWIGLGTPQVKGIPLRYVFFPAPDFDNNSQLIKHPIMERFYSQKVDAQMLLKDWLDECVIVVAHTLLWIEDRLRRKSLSSSDL